MEFMNIPADRVGALIGKDGVTKRRIQLSLNVKLKIESDGRVEISSEDSINEWKCKDIIKAIGRGFAPERALTLLEDDKILDIIDLEGYVSTPKAVARQRSRVIGKGGLGRRRLEQLLDVDISVYGDTVAVIGTMERVNIARVTIEKLISGAMHNTAFRLAEKQLRDLKW